MHDNLHVFWIIFSFIFGDFALLKSISTDAVGMSSKIFSLSNINKERENVDGGEHFIIKKLWLQKIYFSIMLIFGKIRFYYIVINSQQLLLQVHISGINHNSLESLRFFSQYLSCLFLYGTIKNVHYVWIFFKEFFAIYQKI